MNKKPFDQRSESEILIAQQIREKNAAIVKQQRLVKSEVKNKVLVKNPPKRVKENGFVSMALIALFIGIIIGVLTMLIVSIMQ